MLANQLYSMCAKYQNKDGYLDVILPEFLFERMVSVAVASIKVDEDWYRSRYNDVNEAINAGSVGNAAEHYRSFGWRENRLPRFIKVDEIYYCKNNPDVAAAISKNEITSAQSHFESSGASEGRLPYEGFSLF